jgi:hypothetical protein
MRDFFERNKLPAGATPAQQAARYVSLAYTLGPAPAFEAPPRSSERGASKAGAGAERVGERDVARGLLGGRRARGQFVRSKKSRMRRRSSASSVSCSRRTVWRKAVGVWAFRRRVPAGGVERGHDDDESLVGLYAHAVVRDANEARRGAAAGAASDSPPAAPASGAGRQTEARSPARPRSRRGRAEGWCWKRSTVS